MHFIKKAFTRFSFLLFLTLSCLFVSAQTISVCSWNLKDFGRTKTDSVIAFIAETINEFDIVLLQEVVAGDPAGAQAVGRLGESLNRLGAKWEYRISVATSGESGNKKERYAFLWKSAKVKLVGKPWLEKQYGLEIEREPFYATFTAGSQNFTLVNFHAITKIQQPEKEIKFFKFLPAEYPTLNLIFCGDFNVPQSHTVFIPLRKMGYTSAMLNQKTSLKQECIGDDCLASEFDNFFYNSAKVKVHGAGIIPFYTLFSNNKEANKVSDHVPIFMKFSLQ